MLEHTLWVTHNVTTFLFGIFISAAFLGIQMNRINILSLLGFSLVDGIINILITYRFGEQFATQVYPFMIHIPLIIFLTFFFKKKAALSALSVLTAYLFCQISKWIGLLVLHSTHQEWMYYSARIIITVFSFVILFYYVSRASAQLMQKPTNALLIFALMPLTYYVFDYVTTVYTSLLYSGKKVVVEFPGFVLCITYLLFILVYFKQYEEKIEAEQKNRMLDMQRIHSQKEIEAIKRSEYTVSLLRHDLRHFLVTISGFVEQHENDKAKEYIREILHSVDATTMHKFCKNEIVNMILSSYENQLKENKIALISNIQIPEQLHVSDVDLTSILSNALENAISAVLPLEETKRKIIFDLKMNNDKLLISMKNPFAEKPKMADGIPLCKKAGHGFGTQSIRYVTEKLNGNWQFAVKDEWFIIRIIL